MEEAEEDEDEDAEDGEEGSESDEEAEEVTEDVEEEDEEDYEDEDELTDDEQIDQDLAEKTQIALANSLGEAPGPAPKEEAAEGVVAPEEVEELPPLYVEDSDDEEEEDDTTRVLSVAELEDLFERSAPPLEGELLVTNLRKPPPADLSLQTSPPTAILTQPSSWSVL